MIWRCAGDFFKVLLKFKKAATDQTQKKMSVNFFYYFNITFLATWGCASDFLKMPPKFKIAAKVQLQIFCGRKNSKTLSQKLF